MSKICILLHQPVPNKALIDFAKALNVSMGEVKVAIDDERPICSLPLFMNDHVEVAATLRNTLALMQSHQINFNIFELEPSEEFSTAVLEECEISAEILENILQEADERFQ